jgi:hypothetical protein
MVSVNGVVSGGAPEVGVVVTLVDAKGTTVSSSPTDAKGSYAIPAGAYAFPVALTANAPSGVMVSVLAPATAPADNSSTTANVSTLTTALASLLTNGQPTNTAALTAVTPGEVAAAVGALDSVLKNVLAADQVSSTLNPVTDPLTANGTGQDAVIDAVSIVAGPGGPTLILAANAPNQAPSAAIALTAATITAPPAPLPAPPASSAPPATPASYIDYVRKALQDCVALPVPQRSTAARCTDVVDPAFKQNGYTNLADAVPDLASPLSVGAAIALPNTLFFYSNAGQNQSIVRIYYTLSDGTQSSFTTHAQLLPSPRTLSDGSSVTWDLIGNQQDYDASINSRLQRNTAVDAAGDVSAYLSGLAIDFNPNGPNAANVNSVKVTGPGLPSSGVWLRRTVVCNNGSNMALMGTPPTTAPTSTAPINSDTGFFRWDWKAIQTGATVSPGGQGVWAAAPVDVTTIPMYAAYTFTPYDATGTALTSFTKFNLAPPTAAAAGSATAWNTLSAAFVSAFLNPTGTQAAAQSTEVVSWSRNALAAPPQTVYVGSLQSSATSYAETDGSAHIAPTATSVTVNPDTVAAANLAVSCPGTFAPLQSVGDLRYAQLRMRDTGGLQLVDQAYFSVKTAASTADALMTGSYFGVNYIFHSTATQPAAPAVGQPLATPLGFSDIFLAGPFDGAGSFNFVVSANDDGTQSPAASTTGAYAITTTGTSNALTLQAGSATPRSGAVLADGSVAVAVALGSGTDPAIDAIARSGSGFSNASLNGQYTLVTFYNDPTNTQPNMVAQGTPMPVPTGFHSEVIALNADGAGNFSASGTNNRDGTALPPTTSTGTYSVAPSGAVTVISSNSAASPPSLNLAAGGVLGLLARQAGTPVNMGFLLKHGSGMSNASLKGTYAVALYSFDSRGSTSMEPLAPAPGAAAPVPKGFGCGLLTAVADGAGNISFTGTGNSDGVLQTVSGQTTYTIAADGTITLMPASGGTGSISMGAVSGDGNILVGASTSGNPQIIIAIRQ